MHQLIEKYFGTQARFANFMLKFALVFVVAQQIYFPQELRFFHLALLFVYIVFLEFFLEAYRQVKQDYLMILASFLTGIISIAQGLTDAKLATFYLVFLTLQNYLVFSLIYRIYSLLDVQNLAEIFTKKNYEVIIKGRFFIKLILLGVILVLFLAFVYSLYYFFSNLSNLNNL